MKAKFYWVTYKKTMSCEVVSKKCITSYLDHLIQLLKAGHISELQIKPYEEVTI